MADPQVLARNMIVAASDPELGPIRTQGNPIKQTATILPPAAQRPNWMKIALPF